MQNQRLTWTLIALAAATFSFGDYMHMIQARDTSVSPPNETFIWNYDSFNDLVSHTNGTWDSVQIDIVETFRTVGLAYDGKYRMMLQNRDTGEPNESYIWTYDTYGDMVNGTNGTWALMQADIADEFQTVSLFYDGAYHMMLQKRDTSTSPPTETYLWSYNTFNDLVTDTNGSWQSMQFDVPSDYQTVGVAYDGKYRMMVQSRDPFASPPTESYIWTFDTLNDMVNHLGGTYVSGQFDVAEDYYTVGLAYVPVPEPSTIVALGLGGLTVIRRRRRRVHCNR